MCVCGAMPPLLTSDKAAVGFLLQIPIQFSAMLSAKLKAICFRLCSKLFEFDLFVKYTTDSDLTIKSKLNIWRLTFWSNYLNFEFFD